MVFREIITIANGVAMVFNAKVNTDPMAWPLWFKSCQSSALGTWKPRYPLGCPTHIVDKVHIHTH